MLPPRACARLATRTPPSVPKPVCHECCFAVNTPASHSASPPPPKTRLTPTLGPSRRAKALRLTIGLGVIAMAHGALLWLWWQDKVNPPAKPLITGPMPFSVQVASPAASQAPREPAPRVCLQADEWPGKWAHRRLDQGQAFVARSTQPDAPWTVTVRWAAPAEFAPSTLDTRRWRTEFDKAPLLWYQQAPAGTPPRWEALAYYRPAQYGQNASVHWRIEAPDAAQAESLARWISQIQWVDEKRRATHTPPQHVLVCP